MTMSKFDLNELGRLVAVERKKRGLSLREAANVTGIPFNTFARVEKGHVPDLPKFKRLVEWCGVDIQDFFELQERATSTTDLIAEYLRADRNLPDAAAEQLILIVNEIYHALARPHAVSAVHLRAAKTFRPDAARYLGLILNDLQEALLEESIDGAA